LNLRRICSAVIAAFERRAAAAATGDDSDYDSDDDSTYVPDECCPRGEDSNTLGVFLKMIHVTSKKLGGKGVVVLDASGVSSGTNKTLWNKNEFEDMVIVKDIYHLSMYVYARGNFEKAFANATKNCREVSKQLRNVFHKIDDDSPHGQFFEKIASRETFFMVGKGHFEKKKFHHHMGRLSSARLLRNLQAEGIDVSEYFSALGKSGYKGLVKKLGEQGISVSEYFSDLGQRGYQGLLKKLEAEGLSVSEYFKQISHRGLVQCSKGCCNRLVRKAGYSECRHHRYCSIEGCGHIAASKGLCGTHGGKKKCSIEGCANIAVSKGLRGTHGAQNGEKKRKYNQHYRAQNGEKIRKYNQECK